MHALVSTARFLLLVDLESGSVEAVESHRPEYYGVSWFPGSAELVLSHSAINNADLLDIASYATSEVGFISHGEHRSPAIFSQPHQLLCASDGRVVVTNTGRNCIQAIDLDRPGHLQEVRVSGTRWDRLNRDGPFGDHLNSVFERDGKLYAIAHGFHAGSKLATLTYPGLELISLEPIPNITGAHNVCVLDGGQTIGCHSEIGALADLATGETLWEAGSRIYTRGLAATPEHLFIGESEISVRENRNACSGGIWIVDRDSMRTRDYIPLGPYGVVHDVRLIDVPDLAHHGIPLAGGCHSITGRVAHRIRSSRIAACENASEAARYWGRFTLCLGFPGVDGAGWRTSTEELFIAVLKKVESELRCEYRLNPSGPSHVALIAGYQGGGADARMDAFLIQAEGESAALTLWRHEGIAWRRELGICAEALPLAGEMKIKVEGGSALVLVNGRTALASTPLQPRTDGGRLGIRCLGASVRPRPAEAMDGRRIAG